MAFNHVGNCDCPVGCCDCGPPSPKRDFKYLLQQSPFSLWYHGVTKEEKEKEFRVVLKKLDETALTLKLLGPRFEIAYDAICKHRNYVQETLETREKQEKKQSSKAKGRSKKI